MADPFLAAGRLARGTKIVHADEVDAFLAELSAGKFGQSADIAADTGALPLGVTTTFATGDAGQRIELGLFRPAADAIEVTLALQSADAQRERVTLGSKPTSPPTRFAIVVPSQFSTREVKAIVAVVSIDPANDSPEHAQAVAACVEQLNASPVTKTDGTAAETGVTAALRSMQRPETARVAMIYLAGDTGATILGDVALVAQDAVISKLSARIVEQVQKAQPTDAAQLTWLLDRTTLEHLAAMQSAQQLPSELAGVLARVAGEAARNAGSLDELTRVSGREQFDAQLIAENFTYLEDASPAARVRAFDWLNAHGRAPAKYDPLGPAKERTAAIDAALSAQTANTTGGVP